MLSSNCKGKHPLQSGCSRISQLVLTDTAYPVGRQDRHFYFRFFLFWRKVSNATTNIPVATIKDATAKIVDTISYDVITPPPFLCIPVNWSLDSGGYHPVMGLLIEISYHILNLSSIVFASFLIHNRFRPLEMCNVRVTTQKGQNLCFVLSIHVNYFTTKITLSSVQ